MRKYELMLVAIPELSKEELTALNSKISSFTEREKGRVLSFDTWKDKYRFTYVMVSRGAQRKKYIQGTYLLSEFVLPPIKLAELKYILGLDENILRYLIVNRGRADGQS